MDTILGVVNWVMSNYQLVVTSLVAILSGIIAISMLIPGDQPEKFLQSIVNFLSKFSKK